MRKLVIEIPFFCYKTFVSPVLKSCFGGGCIYTPTCSEYAKECLQKHGLFKGTIVSLKRILRCNSFNMGDVGTYDPVP